MAPTEAMKTPQLFIGVQAEDFLRQQEQLPRVSRKVPRSFQDQDLAFLDDGRSYTVSEEVCIEGMTTFLPEQIRIQLKPLREERVPEVTLNGSPIHEEIKNLRKGIAHCLAYTSESGEKLEIIEHLFSLLGALHITADINIESPKPKKWHYQFWKWITGVGVSLPSFREGNNSYLQKIKEAGIEARGKAVEEVNSVQQTVVLNFGDQKYVAIAPPENDQTQLELVNRVHYPRVRGYQDQEMRIDMTPSLYAGICAARPPAIDNWRTHYLRAAVVERIPLTSLSKKNVVLVNHQGIINPDGRYEDQKGFNWEPFCHEIVDKFFPIAFLEKTIGARLLGQWVCSQVSHAQELQFLQTLMKLRESLSPSRGTEKLPHSTSRV
jgi:UDP-3-O-acyl-N-acetylglucosamine deacetylase